MSTCGTGSPATICAAGGRAVTAHAHSLPSSSPASAPTACSSGLNSAENAGRGLPSPAASTSRSTPVSCSAISPAEAKRRAGVGVGGPAQQPVERLLPREHRHVARIGQRVLVRAGVAR